MTKGKIQAARDSGYSDDEIAQYLSSSDEKFKKAIESGYSIDEVADYLALKEKPQQEGPAEPAPTEPVAEAQAQTPTQEEGPSTGRIAAGLGTEIAAAEGLKYAGATLGPWGYFGGALVGGVTGSVAAQKIENPNKPISVGRVIADTALNFIPGQKLFKGAKATTKVGKALVGTGQVAARSALGAGLATGAQAVEKGIDEQRMLTEEELKQYLATGAALGGGLEVAGKAIKTFSPKLQELFKKSPEEIDNLVKAGDPETIKAVDEFYNRADVKPEDLASSSDEEFVKKIIDRSEPAPKIDVETKPKEQTAEIIERPVVEEIPTEVVDAGPQRQITTDVQKPKETEYDIPEEPSIAKSISQLAQGFKSRFAPSLVAGGQTIAAEAKAAKAMAEAGRETGAILESKINRVVSKSKNPEEANRLAYEFINGKIDELPADLKSIEQDLLQGRKWIDEYQDVLLSNHYAGRRQLEEPLLREIERSKNDGDYLTKAYLFFESPAYNPSKQQRAALKAALIRNGMEAGDADVYLAQLDAKRAGGPDDVSNFVFQSPAGILKERKELIPELRNYLGEATQTGSRLAATMSKLSRIDAYDTADFNIKTGLKNLGIAVSKEEGIPQGYNELVLRRTPKLRPDQQPPADQLYVPEDVQRSINALYGADADNNAIDYTTRLIGDLFKTGGSLSSAVKTVFSPFSYTVQPMANMVLAFTAGGNPFKGLMRGGKYGLMQYKNIASRMGIDSVAEFKRRKELNIIGQGMIQGNLEAGLRGPKIGALVGKGVKPFGVAYSLTDSAFRNPVYENNLSFLNRVAPSSRSNVLSRKTEEIAASITNLTYPNYDYANTSLRTLSKYQALISAYATFPLEMFRTVYGQGKLAAKMIDGSFANFLEKQYGNVNREAIKNEGYARAARLIAALSMPMAGANLYSKTKGGVDKDEQEAVRESALPSYDEYTPTAMHKDKDGNYYITNMAYTFPQADIASVFVAGFREDDFPTALEKATKSLWSKVAGGNSFLIEPLFAAFGNYDPKRGEKISKEVDFLPNVLDRSMWFAEQAFKTGLQKEFEKATKAYNPTSAQELVMKAMGLRTRKVNPVEGVGFRLREITKDLNDIRSDYASATYNIAGEDLENEYNKQNRIYQDNFKILSKHVSNMYKMGFPREKVIQVMVDNGIGRANTLLAINGYTPSIPKVKEVTASTEWDRISQLAPKEQIDAIRKIEDRKMREMVFSLRKSDMIDKRRGITEEDKLWKSLEDRERISMAKDMMRQHSDPSAVLLGLLRKGKISEDNYREIKKQMP